MARNTRSRLAFSRTIQPMRCMSCQRNTTDYEESTVCLAPDMRTKIAVCTTCYEQQGVLNAHADGRHRDEPCNDCPDCTTNVTRTERLTARKEPAMRNETTENETTEAIDAEVELTDAEALTGIDALAATAKEAAAAHKAAIEALAAAKEALREAKAAAIAANTALREARAAEAKAAE